MSFRAFWHSTTAYVKCTDKALRDVQCGIAEIDVWLHHSATDGIQSPLNGCSRFERLIIPRSTLRSHSHSSAVAQ